MRVTRYSCVDVIDSAETDRCSPMSTETAINLFIDVEIHMELDVAE